MKTTKTIFIATVLILQVSNLFAVNDIPPVKPNNDASASYYISLVPSTPLVATFEDEFSLLNYAGLTPVTPSEATFEDDVDSMDELMLMSLAPTTPLEADFHDDDISQTFDFSAVAPTTPAEADFSDSL